MPAQTPSSYTLSQVRPPWLHALYGYAGPQAGKQQRFLTPPEQPEFTHQHLRMLDGVLGRTECAGRFALTFADLSRRTPGATSGRGCLALVLTSRVENGIDSAGRSSPTFKHALIAPERLLDRYVLQSAALALIHSTVGIETTSKQQGRAHEQYLRYIEALSTGIAPEQACADFLIPYLQSCLPFSAPPRAQGAPRFVLPKQDVSLIHITYRRTQDLVELIAPAAQLAAILYSACVSDTGDGQSFPWVAVEIGTTRYVPEKDGLTVRFIPEDEQVDSDGPALMLKLDELPQLEDDTTYAAELARAVFQHGHAEPLQELPRAVGWARDKSSAGEPSKTTSVISTERSGPSEARTVVQGAEGAQRWAGKRTNGAADATAAAEPADRQTRPMPVLIPPLSTPQLPLLPRRRLRPLLWGAAASWLLLNTMSSLKTLFVPAVAPTPVASTLASAPVCSEVRCDSRDATPPPPQEAPGASSLGRGDDRSDSKKRHSDKEREKDKDKVRESGKGADRGGEPLKGALRLVPDAVSSPMLVTPPSERLQMTRKENKPLSPFDHVESEVQARATAPRR